MIENHMKRLAVEHYSQLNDRQNPGLSANQTIIIFHVEKKTQNHMGFHTQKRRPSFGAVRTPSEKEKKTSTLRLLTPQTWLFWGPKHPCVSYSFIHPKPLVNRVGSRGFLGWHRNPGCPGTTAGVNQLGAGNKASPRPVAEENMCWMMKERSGESSSWYGEISRFYI